MSLQSIGLVNYLTCLIVILFKVKNKVVVYSNCEDIKTEKPSTKKIMISDLNITIVHIC